MTNVNTMGLVQLAHANWPTKKFSKKYIRPSKKLGEYYFKIIRSDIDEITLSNKIDTYVPRY